MKTIIAAIIISFALIVSSLIFYFAPKPGRYVYSEDISNDPHSASVKYCRDTCKGVTYAYSWSIHHNAIMKIDDKTQEILFYKRIDSKTGKIEIERNKKFWEAPRNNVEPNRHQ